MRRRFPAIMMTTMAALVGTLPNRAGNSAPARNRDGRSGPRGRRWASLLAALDLYVTAGSSTRTRGRSGAVSGRQGRGQRRRPGAPGSCGAGALSFISTSVIDSAAYRARQDSPPKDEAASAERSASSRVRPSPHGTGPCAVATLLQLPARAKESVDAAAGVRIEQEHLDGPTPIGRRRRAPLRNALHFDLASSRLRGTVRRNHRPPEFASYRGLPVHEPIAGASGFSGSSIPRVVAGVRDAGVERGGVDVRGRGRFPGTEALPGSGSSQACGPNPSRRSRSRQPRAPKALAQFARVVPVDLASPSAHRIDARATFASSGKCGAGFWLQR